MSDLPKTRGDSRLASLSARRKTQLFKWLDNGMSYKAATERIANEWGISPSTGTLSKFWRDYCAPRLLASGVERIALDQKTLVALIIELRPFNRISLRVLKGPAPGWRLTQDQHALFWRVWSAACRYQQWTASEAETKRREILSQLGFDSAKHIDSKEGFDSVKRRLEALAGRVHNESEDAGPPV